MPIVRYQTISKEGRTRGRKEQQHRQQESRNGKQESKRSLPAQEKQARQPDSVKLYRITIILSDIISRKHTTPIFRRKAKKFRRPGLSTPQSLLPSAAKPGSEVKLGGRPYREGRGIGSDGEGAGIWHTPCTMAIADKDCRSAWAGLAGTVGRCFCAGSG